MNIERFDQNFFMKAKSAIRGVLFELFVLFTCFEKLSHIIELVQFRSGVTKKMNRFIKGFWFWVGQ